jgi:hypothetical protein
MGRDQTKSYPATRAAGWRRWQIRNVLWWDTITREPNGGWCLRKRHRNGTIQLSWPKISDDEAHEFQRLKSEMRSGRAAPPSC